LGHRDERIFHLAGVQNEQNKSNFELFITIVKQNYLSTVCFSFESLYALPSVNFIKILQACFLLVFWRQKISNPKHSFVIFNAKISYKKLARKRLMKLATGF
jgi:hypothetical protein